ncbi:MAG: hypothetical protein ACE5E8_08055 [Acidimicrobiia bacterium]
MDLNKLGTGQKIAGIAGVVLIINLFLAWYSLDFGIVSASANAFDAGFLAWGGSFVAIAGAVVLLLKSLDVTDAKVGDFQAEQIGLGLGVIGAVLILLRFLTETDFVSFGLWLGLIAAAAVAYGGFQATRDAGLEVPGLGGRAG